MNFCIDLPFFSPIRKDNCLKWQRETLSGKHKKCPQISKAHRRIGQPSASPFGRLAPAVSNDANPSAHRSSPPAVLIMQMPILRSAGKDIQAIHFQPVVSAGSLGSGIFVLPLWNKISNTVRSGAVPCNTVQYKKKRAAIPHAPSISPAHRNPTASE